MADNATAKDTPDTAKAATAASAREAISSAPMDVVEIGSDEPKSPRRGWWSRS